MLRKARRVTGTPSASRDSRVVRHTSPKSTSSATGAHLKFLRLAGRSIPCQLSSCPGDGGSSTSLSTDCGYTCGAGALTLTTRAGRGKPIGPAIVPSSACRLVRGRRRWHRHAVGPPTPADRRGFDPLWRRPVPWSSACRPLSHAHHPAGPPVSEVGFRSRPKGVEDFSTGPTGPPTHRRLP